MYDIVQSSPLLGEVALFSSGYDQLFFELFYLQLQKPWWAADRVRLETGAPPAFGKEKWLHCVVRANIFSSDIGFFC